MKKKILLTLFICGLIQLSIKSYSQCISYDVHACIDVVDLLHVQGNQMWWVHQGGSNPGQHSSCSGDVLSVNGTPWGSWSTPFTLAGVTTCMDVTSTVTQCSNSCSLVQAPSGSNGWETIYRFDDSGPSAAHPYKIVFTFCPATPTSTFTVSSPACSGNDVTITYTGTGTSTATYNWDFNGATVISGAGQGPYIVNWGTAGTYNVTLDVTDCSSTSPVTTVPVQVAVSPTSTFTSISPVCEDSLSVVTYTGTGTAGATYNWNFDGGTIVSGAGQGPYTVSWSTDGVKNISLDLDESGCLSPVTTNNLTVIAPKTSTFITSPAVCQQEDAVITYTGSASPAATYSWNFDGGIVVSGSGQGPYTIMWTTNGTKNITLTVTENSCPSELTAVQQIVQPLPSADFSFTNVCLNEANSFNDLSSGGTITAWSWSFGDGSAVNTNQNPAYTYSNDGIYSVSLLATDDNGCMDTTAKTVTVHPLPVANFSAANVCDGTSVTFNNLSTVDNPDIMQTSGWSFGDMSFANSQNASHLYSTAGSYPIKLVVGSDFGCLDSVTGNIIVNPNPVVDFVASVTTACQPLCTSLQDQSSGLNIQWTWDTGDGTIINNSQNFDHCFTNDSVFAAKTYSIVLTVTSDSGCIGTLTKNNYITVYPNPSAIFSVDPQIALYTDPVIQVTDSSSGTIAWDWDFGDLQTALIQSPPPHVYADTGIYTITLISSNQYNCADTAYKNITIEPDFVFYIPNAFSPDGDNINDTFSGKGIFINTYEMRIFDRWGNLVFLSDSIDKSWDGKSGNEIVQRDVYVYSITITDFKNRKHNYKGTVSLIK